MSTVVIQEQVVNLPGAFVAVALDVSDAIFASSQALDSTQQTVDVVRIYVDVPPYDDKGNTSLLFTLTGSQLQAGVSSEGSPTTLGVATIVLDQLLDTRPGRHAIYAEAVDSDGTVGPVMAAWFEILPPSPTQAPTLLPPVPIPGPTPDVQPTVYDRKTPPPRAGKFNTKMSRGRGGAASQSRGNRRNLKGGDGCQREPVDA